MLRHQNEVSGYQIIPVRWLVVAVSFVLMNLVDVVKIWSRKNQQFSIHSSTLAIDCASHLQLVLFACAFLWLLQKGNISHLRYRHSTFTSNSLSSSHRSLLLVALRANCVALHLPKWQPFYLKLKFWLSFYYIFRMLFDHNKSSWLVMRLEAWV